MQVSLGDFDPIKWCVFTKDNSANIQVFFKFPPQLLLLINCTISTQNMFPFYYWLIRFVPRPIPKGLWCMWWKIHHTPLFKVTAFWDTFLISFAIETLCVLQCRKYTTINSHKSLTATQACWASPSCLVNTPKPPPQLYLTGLKGRQAVFQVSLFFQVRPSLPNGHSLSILGGLIVHSGWTHSGMKNSYSVIITVA